MGKKCGRQDGNEQRRQNAGTIQFCLYMVYYTIVPLFIFFER